MDDEKHTGRIATNDRSPPRREPGSERAETPDCAALGGAVAYPCGGGVMRKGLAIVMAYLATVMVVPLLFVGALLVWKMPIPRGMFFGPMPQVYGMAVFLVFITALPGFALARFGLWWMRAGTLLGFVLAGALAGILAAVLLCLPDQFWVLSRYNVIVPAAVIGAVAGFIYRQVERALSNRSTFLNNALNPGENSR